MSAGAIAINWLLVTILVHGANEPLAPCMVLPYKECESQTGSHGLDPIGSTRQGCMLHGVKR